MMTEERPTPTGTTVCLSVKSLSGLGLTLERLLRRVEDEGERDLVGRRRIGDVAVPVAFTVVPATQLVLFALIRVGLGQPARVEQEVEIVGVARHAASPLAFRC